MAEEATLLKLAGGGILTCPILTTGGYGVVIECQGVKALSNTGNGWSYEMTPAELAKKNEFYSIYWTEYRSVKNSAGTELSELPDWSIIPKEGRFVAKKYKI